VLAGRLGHEAMSQVYQRHLRTGEPVTDILISEGWATAAEIEAALERYRAV
jgi:aspartate ammonia-lyase